MPPWMVRGKRDFWKGARSLPPSDATRLLRRIGTDMEPERRYGALIQSADTERQHGAPIRNADTEPTRGRCRSARHVLRARDKTPSVFL
jgi:hypothetical protein